MHEGFWTNKVIFINSCIGSKVGTYLALVEILIEVIFLIFYLLFDELNSYSRIKSFFGLQGGTKQVSWVFDWVQD